MATRNTRVQVEILRRIVSRCTHVDPTWLNDANRTPTLPLRTGGFAQSLVAGIALLSRGTLAAHIVDPGFAGYCIDAPEHLPAGGSFGSSFGCDVHTQPHPLTFTRGG